MLTLVLGHAGAPPAPHDLWTAWAPEPLALLAVAGAAVLYTRGWRRFPHLGNGRRATAFAAGLAAVAVALLSPLDAVASALASAHMVQHIVLVLVAAPLLAWSGPLPVLLRGVPRRAGRLVGRARRRTRRLRLEAWLLHPLVAWLLHTTVLWVWHAAVLYDAALRHPAVHLVEHAAFFLTALLFWGVVAGPQLASRTPVGGRVLLVFTMGMQSVLLSVLLTFAVTPWYARYATSAPLWGLDPLTDQQLAGVLMWVPAGFLYVAAGLALLTGWLRDVENGAEPPARRRPSGGGVVAAAPPARRPATTGGRRRRL